MATPKKVKCRYCGLEVVRDLAYSPKKGQYYCSKQHYIRKHGYDLLIASAEDILNVKFNKYIKDKIVSMMRERGYDISASYLENDKEYLLDVMGRKRDDIRGSISNYIGVTIANRLQKYEMPVIVEQKPVEVEYDSFSKYKRSNKRRALIDIEMECDDL